MRKLSIIIALLLAVCFTDAAQAITKTEMPAKPKPGASSVKKKPKSTRPVKTAVKQPAAGSKKESGEKTVNRKLSLIQDAERGDLVTFGYYEQDGNTGNGPEPIEWIVLGENDYDEGSYLVLISRYGLDSKPYHHSQASVTWETSSLRQWLNSTFINSAFCEPERGYILPSRHTNDNNSKYGTNGGNETIDYVQMLTDYICDNANISQATRICAPTAYAKRQGAECNEKGYSLCWLMIPGETADSAACIDRSGAIDLAGVKVNSTKAAVRPVILVGKMDKVDEELIFNIRATARETGKTPDAVFQEWLEYAYENTPVEVPDILGMSEAEAVGTLEEAGFSVEKNEPAYSDEYPAGVILFQNPKSGTSLKKGEKVTIRTSLGQDLVTMPDVIGKDKGSAADILAEAGLGINTVKGQYSETVPKGCVISSVPAAGASAVRSKGTDLIISDGPEPESTLFIYAGVPENGDKKEYMTGSVTGADAAFDSRFSYALANQYKYNVVKSDRLGANYSRLSARQFADMEESSLAQLVKDEHARFVILPLITCNRLINGDYMEMEATLRLYDKKTKRILSKKTGYKGNYGEQSPTLTDVFQKFVDKAAADFKELLSGSVTFSAKRTSLSENSVTVECDSSESLRPDDKGTAYYKKSGELRKVAEVTVTAVKKDAVTLKVDKIFDEGAARDMQTITFEFELSEPWAAGK